jgi:hypothetical protein
MNRDLFLSVLAMDSYNRGYNYGVRYSGNQIGTALAASDELLPQGSEAASFYAVAYQYNGETIISYRGTDGLGDPGADLSIGLGNPNSAQAYLAADFYRNVASGQAPYVMDVTFVGHSLAGGLAGLVAGEIANTRH